VTSGRDLAARSEIIILCVTGSPEVEALLSNPGGVLEGLQPGAKRDLRHCSGLPSSRPLPSATGK